MTVSQQVEFKRKGYVAEHLAEILKGLDEKVNTNVLETVKSVGKLSFNGTYYNLETKYNLNLGSVLLSDKELMQIVLTPVAGHYFSTRLHRHISKLTKQTTQAILDGLVRGESYQQIARRLKDLTNMSYNNSLRIARTEAGRVDQKLITEQPKKYKPKALMLKSNGLRYLIGEHEQTMQPLIIKLLVLMSILKSMAYKHYTRTALVTQAKM